jgi:uncharacterized protein (TIGR03000 family)
MNRLHRLGFLLAPVLAAALCQSADAGWSHWARCGWGCGSWGCASNCETTYQTVERTVMVPEMVTENRTVNVVECKAEEQQYTYAVCRPVTEKHTVEYQYTVPTYETRTREVRFTVCKPVMTTQRRQCTVMVPHTETCKGTRQVCRMVPVVQSRTVCEDHGCWKQVPQTYTYCCCGCVQTCTIMCNVWEPKIESREVQYPCMQPQMEQVPYEYAVTVCKPETQTQNVQVCTYVQEQQSRTESYQVCVPQQRTGTREVATCRMVTEQHTATRTVQVPHTVQRQVSVQVCHMVPKTITCQVPVTKCTPCAPCNAGCNGCNTATGAPGAAPTPVPAAPAPAPAAPDSTYHPTSAPLRNSALLSVKVPADAKVFVNDHPTPSTGADREYISRNLKSGAHYNYAVRVEFIRNGQAVSEIKTVQVTAGQSASLDFSQGETSVQTAANS